MHRGWIALFITGVVATAVLFGILDENGKRELKQQASAAYTWVSCRVNGGDPQSEPTKENNYFIACKINY